MKRRILLKGLSCSVAASVAGCVSPYGAEAEEVRSRVRTASEPTELKITDLRVARMPVHFRAHVVRIDTNQGVSGYGEIRDGASPTYALMLKSRILGKNPCNIDKIFRHIKQFGGHGRQAGGVVAVEMACWDLAGKAWGVPCWQMLGGLFRDRVRMYADTPFDPDPEVTVRRLRRRLKLGYTFLKMDVGIKLLQGVPGTLTYPRGQGIDPYEFSDTDFSNIKHPFTGIQITDKGLDAIAQYVRRIRERVGWDIPIAADHFGRIGLKEAIKLARALDPFNLAWLEDMIPWQYTDQYAELKRSCSTPILTGEDIYCKEGFLPLFEKSAITICHPDMMTSGGLLETKKIADIAMEHGIPMAMHMAGSPIGLMGSVHCAAATENFMVMEHHDVDTPYYDDLVTGLPKPIVQDGFVPVPAAPGFGVALNEEVLKDLMRRRGWNLERSYFPSTDQWNDERSHDRLFSRRQHRHSATFMRRGDFSHIS
ncbi:MAG: mandelate racemase/muconate lactonizing enzyme family protein [Phycisphaerales bacterium]|nr:MAG: mandelate racemase/muconate lactonizing enzyme family protein [Phycisphaerales bacterium]